MKLKFKLIYLKSRQKEITIVKESKKPNQVIRSRGHAASTSSIVIWILLHDAQGLDRIYRNEMENVLRDSKSNKKNETTGRRTFSVLKSAESRSDPFVCFQGESDFSRICKL